MVLLLSFTCLLFLVPRTKKKNEGRKGQWKEMKKMSLRGSSAFSAAPGKAFAIQRVLVQRGRPPVTQAHFSALKGAVIVVSCAIKCPHFRKWVNAKGKVPILEQRPTCLCAWEELDGASSEAGHAGVGVLVYTGQWWRLWWTEKREIKHFRKHFGVETFLPNCSRQHIFKNNKPKPNRRYLHVCDLS